MADREFERVPFKLFRMPCCGFMCCWVNPRLPHYCPECGARVSLPLGQHVLKSDDYAILEVHLS